MSLGTARMKETKSTAVIGQQQQQQRPLQLAHRVWGTWPTPAWGELRVQEVDREEGSHKA